MKRLFAVFYGLERRLIRAKRRRQIKRIGCAPEPVGAHDRSIAALARLDSLRELRHTVRPCCWNRRDSYPRGHGRHIGHMVGTRVDRLMFLSTVHDCLLGQFGMCRIDPTQQDMFTA